MFDLHPHAESPTRSTPNCRPAATLKSDVPCDWKACCGVMIKVLAVYIALILSIPGISALSLPGHVQTVRRHPIFRNTNTRVHNRMRRANVLAMNNAPTNKEPGIQCMWSPQDLTKDCPGFPPIPDDDYVKMYNRNPELWPVEFFLIAYRRTIVEKTGGGETQVLVRKSANGTSKWGVGTGVPATRWMLSVQERPPLGYRRSASPGIRFEAKDFPEHSGQLESWTYEKIDIREDAFKNNQFEDPELEEYANQIRKGLRTKLSEEMDGKNMDSWEASRISVVKRVVDNANSLAAIQGTLRMSGLFAKKKAYAAGECSPCSRYVSLGENAPDPAKLVQSMRIFTMFPQMPDPMPLPWTPPEELQKEITSRESRMKKSGRDPHRDPFGRKFTHKSTSNVSNTIVGVYLILDATDLPGLDEVPALDLFGTKEIRREWKSLRDLGVLDSDGNIGTEDTKPTFISGFIVRQLAKDKAIGEL